MQIDYKWSHFSKHSTGFPVCYPHEIFRGDFKGNLDNLGAENFTEFLQLGKENGTNLT